MPDWVRYVRSHLTLDALRRERADEIVEDLARQLEDCYQEALGRGLTSQQAEQHVRAQIRDWESLESDLYRTNRGRESMSLRSAPEARPAGAQNLRRGTVGLFIAGFWKDLYHSARSLRRTPAFTTVAVLTLGLGIGANAAIFSVANAVLFRPLPFLEPDRLYIAWETEQDGTVLRQHLSYPNFVDWKERTSSFDKLAVFRSAVGTFSTPEGAERLDVNRISAEFFPALGVRAFLGRVFSPADDRLDAAPVVILSYGFWQGRFGGDPAVLGQTLTLDGRPSEIVGILPQGFDFPFRLSRVDLWTPIARDRNSLSQRGMHSPIGLARLKDGVTFEQAQEDLSRVAAQLAQEYPATNEGRGGHLVPLGTQVVGDSRLALQILLGVVGFVLLISCANVANLLLTRGSSRTKELAIRSAMGASREQLIRLLLVESLWLGSAGGAVGFLLAFAGRPVLQTSLSVLAIPRLAEASLDFETGVFVAVLSLVTATLFGAASALHSTGHDFSGVLQAGGRSSVGPRGRILRNGLVVVEMALALVLLVGAGLMIRSFYSLMNVPTGFDTRNLLSFQVLVPGAKVASDDELADFYRSVFDELAAVPGVRSVGASTTVPLVGGTWMTEFWILDRTEPRPDEGIGFLYYSSTPDYFRTMGIPLLQGRLFSEEDRRSRPGVVVINQTMAARHWPEGDALGDRIRIGLRFGEPGEPEEYEIIGVVGDVTHQGLDEAVLPQIYVPYRQQTNSAMQVAVRTEGEPEALFGALRAKMASIDPEIPLYRVTTLEAARQRSAGSRRSAMLLLGSFAGLAVVLAAVGLYGVISYMVSRRVHEIGIRTALGARRHDILRLVLGRGMLLATVGVGIGLAGAAALTRVLESFLFNATPTDPATFVVVASALLGIALLACWVPARRALRVDPMVALRYE